MKNRIMYILTVTALVLGAFSAKTYIDQQTSILTAARDLPAAEHTETQWIDDNVIPLAGGPGEVTPAEQVSEETNIPDGPGAGTAVVDEHPNVQKIIDLVNKEREKAGVAPLTKSAILCDAAAVRAKEIATSFSHTRPDGRSYKTALEEAGLTLRGTGENVAMGYSTPESVMNAWMESEGHRNNILLDRYTAIGVGYYKAADGYCYWAQEFSY